MQISLRIVLAIAMAGCSGAALAGEAGSQRVLLQPPTLVIPSPITDRFAVNVSYAYPGMSTFMRYDNPDDPADPGSPFYAEEILGLADRVHQGWMDLMFRIGQRHRIHAQFTQQTRTADHQLQLGQPLEFGSTDFQDGAVVHSEMQHRKMDLIYTYSVLRRETIEVGLGIGLHLIQMYGAIEQPAAFIKEEVDTAGPAASLSGDITWRFTRRFSLNAEGQYLDGEFGDVRGTYVAYRANLQYRAARNLAFGLGYTGTHYEADSTDPEFFSGYLWIHDKGPEAFVRVSF